MLRQTKVCFKVDLMNRAEALAILTKLLSSKIIDLSWVSIDSNAEEVKLKIKETQKNPLLEQFCSNNNLKLEEQNGYWLISKPFA